MHVLVLGMQHSFYYGLLAQLFSQLTFSFPESNVAHSNAKKCVKPKDIKFTII